MIKRAAFPALALALGLALGSPARAADEARPEVGRPLQAAQELIKQQKFREALGKVAEADKVHDLSPYEKRLVEQIRGIAASGAGDPLTAAHAFEAVITGGSLAGAEQLRLVQAVGTAYYQAKDYAKAASWLARYQAEGGNDRQVRPLLAQSYFLAGDYPAAAKALGEDIKAAEQAGQTVPEGQLQLLANVALKQNDTAAYQAALEKLAVAYPKPEYWSDLIARVISRSGFSSRLALDASRLAQAVGTLSTPAQYTEFIELALQAGLPGEAKAVADKGFAAGILGQGAEGDRHRRLRDLATQKAAADLQSLAGGEHEAAGQPDGTGLVNTGLDYLGHGQADKGVALIEQGLGKGNLKRLDDARLHLGIAYLQAGQKAKAVQALKSVEGGDGTADLARLWLLHAGA